MLDEESVKPRGFRDSLSARRNMVIGRSGFPKWRGTTRWCQWALPTAVYKDAGMFTVRIVTPITFSTSYFGLQIISNSSYNTQPRQQRARTMYEPLYSAFNISTPLPILGLYASHADRPSIFRELDDILDQSDCRHYGGDNFVYESLVLSEVSPHNPRTLAPRPFILTSRISIWTDNPDVRSATKPVHWMGIASATIFRKC